jgi:nitrite reductase/ring-hydroxylating ferredoxin subunit
MVTAAIWPALDYSRVPYRLYHDAEIYAREQERIFRGPVWSYLGLDSEIPAPGDFRATWVGETPVIFNRDKSGAVKAFVNRCAHRGALVRRELSGNADEHICIYHQWCYGLDGSLMAIPFRRSIRGKGGLDASFEMRRHGLRPLRVGIINGAVFGTLVEDAEPLEDYLGPPILAQLRRLLDRPVRVLGTIASGSAETGSSMPRIPATTTTPACCTNFSSPSGSTGPRRPAGSRWTRGTVTTSPGPRPTVTPTSSPTRLTPAPACATTSCR